MSVFHLTYSFPHLTIQEFLAAFYLFQHVLEPTGTGESVSGVFQAANTICFSEVLLWSETNENQTTFLEFFNLLYRYNNRSKRLPYHCAHEAQSLIASQQLFNFTVGIAKFYSYSYYDAASFAFVAVSAAQNLREVSIFTFHGWFSRFILHKLWLLCSGTSPIINAAI